jgi:alpha,alpha-trehalase
MKQWTLVYEGYDPKQEPLREALCTLGNGYFATRGAAEESSADDVHYPGTYLAGGYNRLPSQVADRTIINEDLVNFPNWLVLKFRAGDGEGHWFDLEKAQLLAYRQELDMRSGLLTRTLRYRDRLGRETSVASRRMVHMEHPHLAALEVTITPENWSGSLTIHSALDGSVINAGVTRYRQLNSKHLEVVERGPVNDESMFLRVRTVQSRIEMAQAARTCIYKGNDQVVVQRRTLLDKEKVTQEFELAAGQGIPLTIEKILALYTSRDQAISECGIEARDAVAQAGRFDELLESHRLAWSHLWRRCDLEIRPAGEEQMILRLHIFHLLQTVCTNSIGLDVGVPARGWHGEAYRGHIFWDELYILPIYNLHYPETARGALKYRYRRLDQAKAYAREHGYHGAMFPWQSGSDGREETQVLHLNPLSGEWGPDYSSLQRHVSLAIAYNIWEYFWITKDRDFLEKFGAETFLEICRFWDSKATFNQATERYDIDKVMGPDEYHEKLPGSDTGGLLNNSYTNLMVVWVFNRAFDILDELGSEAKQTITQNLQLTDGTLNRWKDICQRISLSISEEGILEQFAGYFGLEELDWEGYRKKYGGIGRLDRILKAEGKSPDDYKLAKQADTLMAFYNLPPEEVAGIIREAGYPVPANLLQVNFDYYIQRTSHGSTLSRLVHAYLAYLVGEQELGWELYMQALKSDYIDIQGGTTKEGIHTGVMAGTIVVALRAFAGVSLDDECLQIHPRLPGAWRSMQFGLGFKDSRYHIVVTPQKIEVKVTNPEDQPVTVIVEGKPNVLIPKKKETIQLRGERQDVR